tara:strand:+ start:1864 stop:1980 length:117 start_codon:yes stop_codon:yes gene_type:complete
MAKQNTSTFEDFINELEEKTGNTTCGIDNPDECDSCGS